MRQKQARDDFSPVVKRDLAARAGHRCSNPDCQRQTSGPKAGPSGSKSIGVAAHITAAAPGGPRFNQDLTNEERASIDNGIWLCGTCSTNIDSDEVRYPVGVLRQWRHDAETRANRQIDGARWHHRDAPPRSRSQLIRATSDPYFVGRSEQIDQLASALAIGVPGPKRPYLLVGGPGVGKTSLVLEFLASPAASQARAVFVDASDAAALMAAMADIAGVREPPTTGVPVDLPGDEFDIIVFDGVTDPGVVLPYLPAESPVRVIVTSTSSDFGLRHEIVVLDELTLTEVQNLVSLVAPGLADDVELLMAEMGSNPLALTQAISVCRTLTISITEYLDRLRAHPAVLLEMGSSGSNHKSLAASLRISLDTLEARSPEALEVLRTLCCLGAGAVPREHLFVREMIACLPGSDWMESSDVIPQSMAIWKSLDRESETGSALYQLFASRLVRPVDDALSVHPLIRMLVLELAPDLRANLEIALGYFMLKLDSPAFVECTRAVALLDLCLATGHVGTAVFIGCIEFAPQLVEMGQRDEAMRLAKIGFEWIQRIERDGHRDALHTLKHQIKLADLLIACDEVEHGRELLRDVVQRSNDIRRGDFIPQALNSLAGLALLGGSGSDIDFVVEHIRFLPPATDLPLNLGAQRLLAQAKVDWCLGDIESSSQAVSNVLETAAHGEGAELEACRLEALQLDRNLSRFMDPATAVAPAVDRMARLGSSVPGSRSHFFSLLDAADTLIEIEDLQKASDALDEARAITLAESHVADDQRAIGCYNSISGRLALHRSFHLTSVKETIAELLDAKSKLELAVEQLGTAAVALVPNLPAAYFNLATVLLALAAHGLGRIDDALAAASKAYELDRNRFGDSHPETETDLALVHTLQQAAALERAR